MSTGDEGPEPPRRAPADGATVIGRWMIVALWVLVLGGATVAAQRWLDAREAARAPVSGLAADGRRQVELRADRRGHYSIVARVDGQPVNFLIDTGASGVTVPESVANRLGLPRGRSFPVVTANGTTRARATRLGTFRLGPFEQRDVAASIAPGMDGDVGLLGMSFLRHFELVQRDGRLIIRSP